MIRDQAKLEIIEAIKQEIVDEILRDVTDIHQKEICYRTGLHQSEVSELLNRKVRRFTIDRLVMVLIALGHRPTVAVC